MTDKIKIFTTGGTIDKVYFDARSTYEIGQPAICELLEGLTLSVDWECEALMGKDSLILTTEDRDLILSRIRASSHKRIVITHGTDTMVETAKHLSELKDKTIVLTGSLQPALFKDSDAAFNIGGALATVQAMPVGVYIFMNGRVFSHDNVCKNLELNRFELPA